MPTPPRISVVTCSYNQGAFIGRTVESVLAQGYPDLEHIIVDGMSRDDTPQVLARYPHLRVIREPDRGQADAINKGFRAATGDVLCFLNSDDTLEPGALARVVAELNPAAGRHVIMGRCRFIDEHDRPTGVEHPSLFVGHRRVLEVWKGNAIPQPATFWTRAVWEHCGPLDAGEQLVMDYDFFCRVSRDFGFHTVDQVLANYRLHAASKTCQAQGNQVKEAAIRASRKYWSGLPAVEYLRLLGSYLAFRLDRRPRALARLQEARRRRHEGRWLNALLQAGRCGILAPDVLLEAALWAGVKRWPAPWNPLGGLLRLLAVRPDYSDTLGYRAWRVLHPDGCAGPVCQLTLHVKPGDRQAEIEGLVDVGHHDRPLDIEVRLAGRLVGRHHIGHQPRFQITLPLAGVVPGEHTLEVLSNTYLVPHHFQGNWDLRPISFRLRTLKLSA